MTFETISGRISCAFAKNCLTTSDHLHSLTIPAITIFSICTLNGEIEKFLEMSVQNDLLLITHYASNRLFYSYFSGLHRGTIEASSVTLVRVKRLMSPRNKFIITNIVICSINLTCFCIIISVVTCGDEICFASFSTNIQGLTTKHATVTTRLGETSTITCLLNDLIHGISKQFLF